MPLPNDTLFKKKAPWIMSKLMTDFNLTEIEAAAILGNLGHESGGFKHFQEIKPIVKGSRGGFGWAQWTGPRRKAFEAYVAKHKLDPYSDLANYAWLFLELSTTEKAAITALKNAVGLENKVKAFEQKFERAHKDYKHYPSRLVWANKALEAFRKGVEVSPVPTPIEVPKPSPAPTVSPIEPTRTNVTKYIGWGTGISGLLIALATALYQIFGG